MSKNALVTGAGIRLGRQIALGLAHDGYDVAVHYSKSSDGARAVVDEIKAQHACQRRLATDDQLVIPV